jgi:hypothetical protein
MCFDEGRTFVSGASILRGGRWHEFTVIDSGDGPQISMSNLVRISGFPVASGYAGATLFTGLDTSTVERFEYESRLHFPARYPSFGGDLYINDAYCKVQWGDRVGFGVLELDRH